MISCQRLIMESGKNMRTRLSPSNLNQLENKFTESCSVKLLYAPQFHSRVCFNCALQSSSVLSHQSMKLGQWRYVGFWPERVDRADVGYVVVWTERKTLTMRMV